MEKGNIAMDISLIHRILRNYCKQVYYHKPEDRRNKQISGTYDLLTLNHEAINNVKKKTSYFWGYLPLESDHQMFENLSLRHSQQTKNAAGSRIRAWDYGLPCWQSVTGDRCGTSLSLLLLLLVA